MKKFFVDESWEKSFWLNKLIKKNTFLFATELSPETNTSQHAIAVVQIQLRILRAFRHEVALTKTEVCTAVVQGATVVLILEQNLEQFCAIS